MEPGKTSKKISVTTRRVAPDQKGAGSHAYCEGWIVLHEVVELEKSDLQEDDDEYTESECYTSFNESRSQAFTSIDNGYNFKSFRSREDGTQFASFQPDMDRDDTVNVDEPMSQLICLDFELPNQEEVIQMIRASGGRLQLSLLYAVLDGSSFNLYKEKPLKSSVDVMMDPMEDFTPADAKPQREYNIFRKQCLIGEDPLRQELRLNMQDIQNKHILKTLQISIPRRITRSNSLICPQGYQSGIESFAVWVESLKIAQRPLWSGEEVSNCFICDSAFGFLQRQHHCRKCGTAVCQNCSKYFVKLPDFAYYDRVRTCRICMQQIYLQHKQSQSPFQTATDAMSHNRSMAAFSFSQPVSLQQSMMHSQNFISLPQRDAFASIKPNQALFSSDYRNGFSDFQPLQASWQQESTTQAPAVAVTPQKTKVSPTNRKQVSFEVDYGTEEQKAITSDQNMFNSAQYQQMLKQSNRMQAQQQIQRKLLFQSQEQANPFASADRYHNTTSQQVTAFNPTLRPSITHNQSTFQPGAVAGPVSMRSEEKAYLRPDHYASQGKSTIAKSPTSQSKSFLVGDRTGRSLLAADIISNNGQSVISGLQQVAKQPTIDIRYHELGKTIKLKPYDQLSDHHLQLPC